MLSFLTRYLSRNQIGELLLDGNVVKPIPPLGWLAGWLAQLTTPAHVHFSYIPIRTYMDHQILSLLLLLLLLVALT